MQRKTLRLATDFFLIGAAVPVILLLIWRIFFENHVRLAAQAAFLRVAFILWPTGMQILVVPHGESPWAHNLSIVMMIVQNAILYSIVALLVAWIIHRVRGQRLGTR